MKIPGYELQDTLGAGGMASVYKAVQLSLNRLVAIKLMREDLSRTPDYTRRFLIEARSVAQLQHRHIISIYDVGTAKDIHFYSMQLLEGGNLLERIHDGSMSRKEIVQALIAVCEALHYSHERGFIHRDVKPANILFDSHDEPYLTDFGLVRDLNTTSALTAAGHSLGTSLYMSPEQITGQSVSPKCDLYGLGVTAYEAILGSTPYQGETSIAVAYQHVNEPVPKLPKGLSSWQSFFNRAMAKEPENRFDNANEMASALRDLLNNPDAMTAKKELTDSGEHGGDATMIMPTISGEAEFKALTESNEATVDDADDDDMGTMVMKVPGRTPSSDAASQDALDDEETTVRVEVKAEDEPDTAEIPASQPDAMEDDGEGETVLAMPAVAPTVTPPPPPRREDKIDPKPSLGGKPEPAAPSFAERATTLVGNASEQIRSFVQEKPKHAAGGLGAVVVLALVLIVWGLWPEGAEPPEPPAYASAEQINDLRTRLLSANVTLERNYGDLVNNTRWSEIEDANPQLTDGLQQARDSLASIDSKLNASDEITLEAFGAMEQDLGAASRQAEKLVTEVRKLLSVQDEPEPKPFVINTEIEVLLEQAQVDIDEGRLFEPEGENAADKIVSALEIDPDYRNTLTLRATVVESVLDQAMAFIETGQLIAPAEENALESVQLAQGLDPDNQRAATLTDRIVGSIVEAGRTDLSEGRLAAPESENAAAKVQSALQISPEDPSAIAFRTEVITALLAAAQLDIDENRLTSPRNENAQQKLELVSELDPESEEVIAYREQIASKYLALAEREVQRASPSRENFGKYLDQAGKFGAPAERIAELETRFSAKTQVSYIDGLNDKADKLMADERFREARLTSLDVLRSDAQNRRASRRLARIEEMTKAGYVFAHDIDDVTPGPTMVVLAGSESVTVPGTSNKILITNSFAISTNEISRDLFARFAADTNYEPPGRGGNNCRKGTPHKAGSAFSKKVRWDDPGFTQSGSHPAVCVDYAAAVSFTQWLSAKTGRKYRLPSEIEWEHATKARRAESVSSSGACQFDNLADRSFVSSEKHKDEFQCDDGAVYTSAQVSHDDAPGKLAGLGGNVSEWTADCWNKSLASHPNSAAPWTKGDCRKRVVRGGSFRIGTKEHPLNYREGAAANLALDSVGFRVVREFE